MMELVLVFVAGILGTAHCLGMCGPFALTIGSADSTWSRALARQSAYSAGRVFTYGFLGAVAGFCGSQMMQIWPAVLNVPAVLAIVAGILIVYQGLKATGLFRSRGVHGQSMPCLAGGLLGSFLRQPKISGVFLAGIFTGLLPCGLLYGMLALALSSRSMIWGGVMMAVFGLGTVPAMMLAGISGWLMDLATRRRLYGFAAWCLILTGGISIVRGVSFLMADPQQATGCPLCGTLSGETRTADVANKP
ncbi:MAG: sulfite exporter TauE/SafE family protein [Planctomycetales bacterium]|nr:sulfite exporter TauE/SafE family protein [Planctomycetales bacterium]